MPADQCWVTDWPALSHVRGIRRGVQNTQESRMHLVKGLISSSVTFMVDWTVLIQYF